MENSQKIIPYSPHPPRILPALTCQYNNAFVHCGDEGMKIPIRTHEAITIGEIGSPCVYVYISSLPPQIHKKKKEKEGILLILLIFFFGLFWGGSSKDHPRIIPVWFVVADNYLKLTEINQKQIIPK